MFCILASISFHSLLYYGFAFSSNYTRDTSPQPAITTSYHQYIFILSS